MGPSYARIDKKLPLMSERIVGLLGAQFEWLLVFDTSLPGRHTSSLISTFAAVQISLLAQTQEFEQCDL